RLCGFLVMAPCYPPSKPSSSVPIVGFSPANWPMRCTPRYMMRFANSVPAAVRHTDFNGQFLYTSTDVSTHRRQLQTRQTGEAVPVAADVVSFQVSPHELQTAILLFYSLLDEQQRRLYAGLESIRLGRGGDTL